MDMAIFRCNNGVSVKYNPIKYYGNYCAGLYTLEGVIWC